ncbi:hypothetical protein DCS_07388 [Drechmeria coniospora]|uniref:Uncharacterized protein n=1 Tax=Drechmeria coniospora TaxID=98403 RepID=A0A151GEA9_DRECN|nr:hypothetical protein DCS_07388 [Drechmeria coniospora]KYK55425.1 hypothetical protein DCS_07388 [Drechmeria coniospora]ODA81967.1 hypothetical protein RJ55_00472 [Drechmeria coniospora]
MPALASSGVDNFHREPSAPAQAARDESRAGQNACRTRPIAEMTTSPDDINTCPGSSTTECRRSPASHEEGRPPGSLASDEGKSQRAGLRWFSQMKSWLSVSEPSAQAMKDQRKSAYRKYGIDLHDPNAAAKMHLPIGKVPEGVTTSTKGPRPEKVFQERAKRAGTVGRQAYLAHDGSQSVSSGLSSNASTKEASPVAPWA